MALPFIIGVAVLLGGIGGITMALRNYWGGKKIVVLGGRGVGKTTFLNYLKTKEISHEKYEQTGLEKYSTTTISIDGISLKISDGYDVGGSHTHYVEWREQIRQADIIFYILDIYKTLNKDLDYTNKVKEDLTAIADEVAKRQKETSKKIPVFLIASHADKHPDYYLNLQKLEEKVAKNQLIGTAIIELGGIDNCQVVIGSLKNSSTAKSLVKEILMRHNHIKG